MKSQCIQWNKAEEYLAKAEGIDSGFEEIEKVRKALKKAKESQFSGDVYTNSIGMTFKKISSGAFIMGSPSSEAERDDDEGPQHKVIISQAFYMQTTEVTQGQWKTVTGKSPARFSSCGSTCPVEQVSWNDVQGFLGKLNKKREGTYRLPTEAEWEYSARAGTITPFSFGNTINANTEANYDGNNPYGNGPKGKYRESTMPVGRFPANAWGLHDMHGSVWEWVQDTYVKNIYSKHTRQNPKYEGSGSFRVFRGGSWNKGAKYLRSANRSRLTQGHRFNFIGFRVVVAPPGL